MMINDFTGQIYLKRMPNSIYTPVEEDLEHLEIVNDNTHLEKSRPEVDYGSIDGCLSFWQAYGDENGIDLIEKSLMPSENLVLHFNNEEEMAKEFIPLTEYLAKAKWVGRNWRLPGFYEFAEMVNSVGETTVLYEFDNISLAVENHYELGQIFKLILRDPEAIEKSSFLCEINNEAEEYKDKAVTYKKVYNFLSKNNRFGL